ncbi:antitoxin YezG family protein [Pseudomonas sp. 7P_10.2_Bac1]|uniref:antitoxin YezG family protein n=1 Tax=Pseudomonas sp. 7P_10.2_Bac1 TaxID=2971614 RepID=UPI0021C961BC|nr:antitoxin YezG family protein [Pseudomonas sp. 7P_10.2_Bac1]MCU1725575.1 antitoxin YezG family protein [Pseudomonas sp. 7P_10.2_Bac1]
MKSTTKNIDEIYPEIGQLLINLLPDDFQEAWISVEMIDDVWGAEIFYKKSENTYGYINDELHVIEDKFRLLRDLLKDKNNETWSTATFNLTNTYSMNLELGYDDISDFGLSPERREAWIKKHLGEAAKIDWS